MDVLIVLMWAFVIILVPFALYVLVRIMSSAWYKSKLDFIKSSLHVKKEEQNGSKRKRT